MLGRAVYSNCAACHGKAGEGAFGPPFASSPTLAYSDYVIAYVLKGSRRMPRFDEQLSPAEIAAVVNYIRNSWGNHAKPVTAKDVEKALTEPK